MQIANRKHTAVSRKYNCRFFQIFPGTLINPANQNLYSTLELISHFFNNTLTATKTQ